MTKQSMNMTIYTIGTFASNVVKQSLEFGCMLNHVLHQVYVLLAENQM